MSNVNPSHGERVILALLAEFEESVMERITLLEDRVQDQDRILAEQSAEIATLKVLGPMFTLPAPSHNPTPGEPLFEPAPRIYPHRLLTK